MRNQGFGQKTLLIGLVVLIRGNDAIYCRQCSGWSGDYAPKVDTVSTCDNSNNACSSAEFCVKIVDPIFSSAGYKTYKSDCYTSTTFTSLTNTTTIVSGQCYNYTDGGTPPKTYLYCFCNNRDYCNSAPKAAQLSLIATILVPIVSQLYQWIQ